MQNTDNTNNIIFTIKEKCKTCYTCVRECPVKAISIINGQAEINPERCITCGNCVIVCSQKAKVFNSSNESVKNLLDSDQKVAAIVAPSFPAHFSEINYGKLVGSIKKLGFDYVNEVGFGADLVAIAYKNLVRKNSDKSYIASSCPSIVSYIEKYYPKLIDNLSPIASPMIATARILKNIHGEDLKIVFIGPCISKKKEILRTEKKEVDEVITFNELEELFKEKEISPPDSPEIEFDEPAAGEGNLFPINGGLLQAAGIFEDLIEENVMVANGRKNFTEAIDEFSKGYLNTKILETISCDGCIEGPGVCNGIPKYRKRHLVSKFVKNKLKQKYNDNWLSNIRKHENTDLSCRFVLEEIKDILPPEDLVQNILVKLGKQNTNDELNCGACGYANCNEHAIAIAQGFAEVEMCLPYTIDQLKTTIIDLENSYKELKNIKEVLNHREKLASLGQLSAGIAHEINNPLGVILMYSGIILEQLESSPEISEDIKVITEQANRCKKIVSGLLNFSRQNKIFKSKTDLCQTIKKCIASINIPENIEIRLNNKMADPEVNIDEDQMIQVLINLINNAIDAMENKPGKIDIKLGEENNEDNNVYFSIKDNGIGISKENLKKIFDPFFTTKTIGKGTGLGLSVSYGVIKMHDGIISVKSNADKNKGETGTVIKVVLPKT